MQIKAVGSFIELCMWNRRHNFVIYRNLPRCGVLALDWCNPHQYGAHRICSTRFGTTNVTEIELVFLIKLLLIAEIMASFFIENASSVLDIITENRIPSPPYFMLPRYRIDLRFIMSNH